MAESSEDVKPGSEQLTICIQLPDSSAPLKMKVKRSTKFEKIFGAFYKNKNMAPGSVTFLREGKKIEDTDTPESLEMDEGEVVDAQLQQTGGC